MRAHAPPIVAQRLARRRYRELARESQFFVNAELDAAEVASEIERARHVALDVDAPRHVGFGEDAGVPCPERMEKCVGIAKNDRNLRRALPAHLAAVPEPDAESLRRVIAKKP